MEGAIHDLFSFARDQGTFQTVVLVIIVGYVVRDWYMRKRDNGLFDALVGNNKIMTSLFEKQVITAERASISAATSAGELTKQTDRLDKLVGTQTEIASMHKASASNIAEMVSLAKAGNEMIEKNGKGLEKFAESFGSDPFKICKAIEAAQSAGIKCEAKDMIRLMRLEEQRKAELEAAGGKRHD